MLVLVAQLVSEMLSLVVDGLLKRRCVGVFCRGVTATSDKCYGAPCPKQGASIRPFPPPNTKYEHPRSAYTKLHTSVHYFFSFMSTFACYMIGGHRRRTCPGRSTGSRCRWLPSRTPYRTTYGGRRRASSSSCTRSNPRGWFSPRAFGRCGSGWFREFRESLWKLCGWQEGGECCVTALLLLL